MEESAALGRLGLSGALRHMDAAYYEDLAGRLYGLLIMLEDRFGREQAREFHRYIEVGEYGLALEEIAGELALHAIAITGQERGAMLALAQHMTMGDGLVERALRSCPVMHDDTAQSGAAGDAVYR